MLNPNMAQIQKVRITHLNILNNPNGGVQLKPKNMQIGVIIRLGQSISHSHLPQRNQESSVQLKKSAQPKRASSEQEKHQTDPDPVFCRKVDKSDLPEEYEEEIETFRHILKLPNPRDTIPRSSSYHYYRCGQ